MYMQIKSELERARAAKERTEADLQRAHIRIDDLERTNREKDAAKNHAEEEI